VLRFSARRQIDPASGHAVAVLHCADPRGGPADLEARVAPHAGANLYWLAAGGEQLLEQAPSLAELAQSPAGTPIMYPSPNRVRDAAFVFEGQRYYFEANSGPNFIHGLVRRRPWQMDEPQSGADHAAVSTWIDWDDRQPDFPSFPVTHRLTVKYTVRQRRLAIEYAVANRGPGRLPFGFGLHPWFRIPGARAAVRLRVPVSQRMEAQDRLPTGRLLPVAGTPFDLRRPTSLAGLDLDDVYIAAGARRPASPAWCEWGDRGLRLSLGASAEFTHLVVYTPAGKQVFCLENQTCSTDAHNLHARGQVQQAHLQIVEPGATARGSLDWRLRRIPDGSKGDNDGDIGGAR
jgi:aldose 1-epimerase